MSDLKAKDAREEQVWSFDAAALMVLTDAGGKLKQQKVQYRNYSAHLQCDVVPKL